MKATRYGQKFGRPYGDGWIKAIFDRTLRDIERRTAKGYLNAVDLNRIENNLEYLSGRLNEFGYNQNVTTGTWYMEDINKLRQLERIRLNLAEIVSVYYPQGADVPISLNKPAHTTINSVEQILHEMRQMIEIMRRSFKRCGTFHSGQEVVF